MWRIENVDDMKFSDVMKKNCILFICLFIYTVAQAQQELELNPVEQLQQQIGIEDQTIEEVQKLKISGYIQPQFQFGGKDASLSVGTANEDQSRSFNRIGIRRGRIKITYDEGIASVVFQLNMTEKGVGIKDAYLNLKEPWFGTNTLRVGVFGHPFGFEINQSSSSRETPERSLVFRTLFPDARDVGGMLIMQATKTSPLHFLKLEAGLLNGNGIKQEIDNRKDFIGHLSVDKNMSHNINVGLGVSYYNGGVYQGTENIYAMLGNRFVLNSDDSNIGKFAKREYFGFDGQLNITSLLGKTKLRGEYLWGMQPGSISGSKSPNTSALPTNDTYIRNFNGGYMIFVQDIGTTPFSAVLKYDWYDPNTKVAANEIGLNDTNKGDIDYRTFGLGFLWRVTNNVRLQAYYEFVNNEKSESLSSYNKDLEDDVFTLRLQYKF